MQNPYMAHQGQPNGLNPAHASSLRCCTICLGVLGLLQFTSVQGIAALCSWCQVGCCGPLIESKVVAAAKSLKCKAYTVIVFAIAYIIGTFVFAEWFCNSVCGVIVTGDDLVSKAQYLVGTTAIAAAEVAYQVLHPTTEVYITAPEIGSFHTMFVYPFDVCDLPVIKDASVAGDGVYWPHPLSTFGTYIKMYLLSTNGLMLVFAAASVYYAAKIDKFQTRPREYSMQAPMAPAVPPI